MLSLVVFTTGIVGLIALFALKSFELSRDMSTPLAHVRKLGDPIVTTSSRECIGVCRTFSRKAVEASTAWVHMTAHNARVSLDEALHTLAARLNRYLRGRRTERRASGEPSARLKTVLQKTDDTTLPPSL